ncbi:ABC transporter permease [Parasedimentitalea psychrophila]|uniref:ABC transporter permease n=1 Tax=Parasedimentitalea psychrophila TaxID=2997337 RepID=A0A9Y2P8U7_9RHOB|nr:ABC transporter permease [Parasedimentitalea psychrophila]WIY27423.1 ABC transporter permease [Parasedimentitalea psychrophila]
MKLNKQAKTGLLLVSPATLYVILLIAAPTALTIAYSFWIQDFVDVRRTFTLANYIEIFEDPLYRTLIFRSVKIATLVTIYTVLLAYPVAYFIAFNVKERKAMWLFLVTIPFWTSYLLRVFSWKIILGQNGVLNSTLLGLGVIDEPISSLLYNSNAVVLTLTHAWAPFAILPIFVALNKIDRSFLEAAKDLGEGPLRTFLRVTLPLSMPGVIGASMIIFIPTVGDYVTPALVGGSDGAMVANMIQVQFGKANNWPLGAALALSAVVCVTIAAVFYVALLKVLERVLK